MQHWISCSHFDVNTLNYFAILIFRLLHRNDVFYKSVEHVICSHSFNNIFALSLSWKPLMLPSRSSMIIQTRIRSGKISNFGNENILLFASRLIYHVISAQ